MNERNTYIGVLLRRYFKIFKGVAYHGVPLCKFTYFQFLRFFPSKWGIPWVKKNLPYWDTESTRLIDSEVYSWSDEPYPYEPHPEGLILMRGGFGDIASLHLPKERYFLISPNQAEVDLIKTNRPDLTSHNLENYYRDNPKAVADLIDQAAQIIHQHQDDPIFGSPDLLEWFKSRMPDFVRYLDAIQSLFEEFPVKAVLSILSIYTGDGIDSALNLIARANRIPSFTLQHGIIPDIDPFSSVPVLATKKLVWGKAWADWFQKYGVPPSRTSVVGSPRFEIIFNQKWCGKEELCKKLNINPAMKVMVYATGTETNTIVPLVLEGLKSIPNLFLILKLHPSESSIIDQYEKLTTGYPNCKVVRFGHIGLYDALSGADLFITQCSTAAIEAMLFKLPVITIEPHSTYFSYGDLGASLKATNSTELHQIVSQLISDETFRTKAINKYQKFISEYCIPDGLASKRLFEEIEVVCQTGGIA